MSEKRYSHDFAVLHPEEPKLLTLEHNGLALPRHSSKEDWLDIEDLPAILRESTGLEALIFRTAYRWAKDDEMTLLYVLEARTATLPPGARWLALDALSALAYPEAEVLRTLLREEAGLEPIPALRPAWAKRGWLDEVKTWLESELNRLGRTPVGEPEQVKHWSLSAVLRQKTDGGEVYFKAMMNPHFATEPPITQKLAELFPHLTPEVLALDEERAWLLLEPLHGEELSEASLEFKCEAVRRHARLQLASVAHKAALLAAGCADRSLAKLKEKVPRLLRESLERERLTVEEREKLLALEPELLVQLDELAAYGLPETLLHGDLHFGNVNHDGARITFFDWTDACFSHPFFDLTNLGAYDRAPEEWLALRDAYLGPWSEQFDRVRLERALELARYLGNLFYAESYDGIGRAQESASRWELSGMTAYHLRTLLA